jgi:hypothetical protein
MSGVPSAGGRGGAAATEVRGVLVAAGDQRLAGFARDAEIDGKFEKQKSQIGVGVDVDGRVVLETRRRGVYAWGAHDDAQRWLTASEG